MEFCSIPSLTRVWSRKALSCTLQRIGLSRVLLLIAALLTLLQLPTAPPLWWDEGWTLTVARNWVATGHYGRLLAGDPISPRLAATPPVVLPVALSFRLFGIGAWQGRLPGVIFTVVTLWLLYQLTTMLYSRRAGIAALVLAVLTPMNPELHTLLIGKQVLGEVPALCFLLAGYLFLFWGLEEVRIRKVMVAGLLWGLAVVTKQQVIPFLTLSVVVVAFALLRQRDWRSSIWCAIPLLMTVAAFLAWRWFSNTRLIASDPTSTVKGLIWVTAVVPALPARLLALMVTSIWGVPIVASLVYAGRHHLDASPRGLQRLALWSLAAGWFAWYLLLSAGWIRYLFPAAFLSLIFFAGLLQDATDNFNTSTLGSLWAHLRPCRWRRLKRTQQMTILLLLLAVPASLTSLLGTYLRADGSVFQVVEYLHSQTPPDALIETYDSELFFLLDRPYHYPPDQVHVELNRRTFLGQDVTIDYDPLAADPDYLVIGYRSRLWRLYEDLLSEDRFVRLKRFGEYEIYQRARRVADGGP